MRLSFQCLFFFQNAMHRSLLKPTFPDLIPQQKEDEWSHLQTSFIQNKKISGFSLKLHFTLQILQVSCQHDNDESMHLSRDLFYHQLTRSSFVSEAFVKRRKIRLNSQCCDLVTQYFWAVGPSFCTNAILNWVTCRAKISRFFFFFPFCFYVTVAC